MNPELTIDIVIAGVDFEIVTRSFEDADQAAKFFMDNVTSETFIQTISDAEGNVL